MSAHRKPAEHGTDRRYHQHRADGTPACAACLDAHAAGVRRSKAARAGVQPTAGRAPKPPAARCAGCGGRVSDRRAVMCRGCRYPDELRYDGGWVRRGLIWVAA